jgi:hypothetical protein
MNFSQKSIVSGMKVVELTAFTIPAASIDYLLWLWVKKG